MESMITIVERIYKPGMVFKMKLSDVVNAIQTGRPYCFTQNLISMTQQIQSLSDHDKQNEMKFWNLPVILYNGIFTYKNNQSLCRYSNFTALDFDNFKSEEDLQHIGYWLTQTPCVYSVFRTPSGHGLKAIIEHDNTNPDYHAEMYGQLLKKFLITNTDTSVCDLARGHYLCYDPNIWVNMNCQPYHFVHDPSYIPTPKTTVSSKEGVVEDMKMLEFVLGMKHPVGNKSDESIINILISHWKKDSMRWMVGNRANSVFSSASEFCKAGVNMRKAIDVLVKKYIAVGLSEDEIVYQASRGYMKNAEKYGYTRERFDSYGNKGRKKR